MQTYLIETQAAFNYSIGLHNSKININFRFNIKTPSVQYYRVIGTMQNSQEFADAFGCKVGRDYMNPSQKCSVW